MAIQLESSISNVSIVLHNLCSGSATTGGGRLQCNNVGSADGLLSAAHYNSAIHSKEISKTAGSRPLGSWVENR